jgi:hypothetical protein
MYKHFPIKGPQKFTQNGNFGMKMNHLATLGLTLYQTACRIFALKKDT